MCVIGTNGWRQRCPHWPHLNYACCPLHRLAGGNRHLPAGWTARVSPGKLILEWRSHRQRVVGDVLSLASTLERTAIGSVTESSAHA